jgi:microcystin-dependent protein
MAIRTIEELLRSLVKRVSLLERRIAVRGASTPSNLLALTGEMKVWPLAAAPDGWILARGQSLLRSEYPDLFAVYGTTFGAADATHFSLPDLRGRAVVGLDSSQTEFDALGEKGGSKTHTLTAEQLPAHNHPLTKNGGNVGYSEAGGPTLYTTGFGSTRANGDLTAGYQLGTIGQSHNNLQPYIVLNYIIKT